MMMFTRVLTLWSVLGLSASRSGFSSAHPSPDRNGVPYKPALLTLKALKNEDKKKENEDLLLQALATTGMFAIERDDSDVTASTAHLALEEWCRCAAENTGSNKDNAGTFTQVMELEDGMTQRTTLASATVGTELLALNEEMCGPTVTALMEDLRDDMAQVSQAVVQALDRVVSSRTGSSTLLYDTNGKSYKTVSSIVADATHLEHFHVYEKKQAQEESHQKTLAFHTDAGLFLAFVPGYDCQDLQDIDTSTSANNHHSFWIRDADGIERPVQFDSQKTRAVVMMGAGAEQWLFSQQQSNVESQPLLRATTHAVELQPGQTRAW